MLKFKNILLLFSLLLVAHPAAAVKTFEDGIATPSVDALLNGGDISIGTSQTSLGIYIGNSDESSSLFLQGTLFSLLFDEISTPSAAPSGKHRLYFATDGTLTAIDDTGTPTQVGGNPLPNFTNEYVLFGDGTDIPATDADLRFDGISQLSIGVNTGTGDLLLGGLGVGDSGTVETGDGGLELSSTGPITFTFNGTSPTGVAHLTSGVLSTSSVVNADVGSSAAINYSKMENLAGLSVLGVTGNSSAAGAAITAGTDNFVLRRSGTALSFGLLTNSNLSGSAGVTNANLASMNNNTVKGNVSGSSAVPSDLTGTQVTTILSNVVGDSGSGGTKGLAPAPDSGDTANNKFLKASGSYVHVEEVQNFLSANARGEFDTTGWTTFSDAALGGGPADTVNDWIQGYSGQLTGWEAGKRFRYTNNGSVPGGLSTNTDYFVQTADPNSLYLSATQGGTLIDLTSAGSSGVQNAWPYRMVNGTGGVPSTTWTQSATSPLEGSGSFLYTHPASIAMGEGVCYAFTTDVASYGKVIKAEFDYLVSSGTFVAGSPSVEGDVKVGFYDVTNSLYLEGTNTKLTSSSTTVTDHFSTSLQLPTNSTSFRFCIYNSSVATSNFVLKMDNFKISPASYIYGSPLTDIQAYTPTLTHDSGTMTNKTVTGMYTRQGDRVKVWGNAKFSGSAGTWGGIQVSLPPICSSIDTAKLANSDADNIQLGLAKYYDASTAHYASGSAIFRNSTTIYLQAPAVSTHTGTAPVPHNQVTQAFPFSFASGDSINWEFEVPCSGFSSSVQMSDNASSRVVVGTIVRGTTQTGVNPNNSAVKIALNTVGVDTHGAVDTTNNRYTVPVSGQYNFSAGAGVSSTNVLNNSYFLQLYKNGVSLENLDFITASTGVQFTLKGSTTVTANAGDYFEIFLFGAGNNSSSTLSISTSATRLTAERISGPTAIGATESVIASYTSSAATSIANSGAIAVPFATLVKDSHGAFVGSTGIFTCPISGQYAVGSTLYFDSSTYAAGNFMYIVLYKNGSAYRYGANQVAEVATANGFSVDFYSTVPCLIGETLQIRARNNRTAGATLLTTDPMQNFVTFVKVANY